MFSESREYFKAHIEAVVGNRSYTTTTVFGSFEDSNHIIELRRGVAEKETSSVTIRKQGLETTYQVAAETSLNSWCCPFKDYGLPDDLRSFTLVKDESGNTPVYSLTEGHLEKPKELLSWLGL